MVKKIISWLLVITSLIIIFMFSSVNARNSTSSSKKIIDKTVSAIDSSIVNVGLNPHKLSKSDRLEIVNFLNVPLRKLVHITEYFILTLLLMNALKVSNVKYNNYIITGILCFLYACSDEFHQMFTGRTNSFIDCLIDSIGIIMALLLWKLITNIKNKNKLVSP